jgi:hypothetical protein
MSAYKALQGVTWWYFIMLLSFIAPENIRANGAQSSRASWSPMSENPDFWNPAKNAIGYGALNAENPLYPLVSEYTFTERGK